MTASSALIARLLAERWAAARGWIGAQAPTSGSGCTAVRYLLARPAQQRA
ncbi:hypothetical protein [Tahibacter caeni]|nr:hypothetical protein [Tahibacter caeni]